MTGTPVDSYERLVEDLIEEQTRHPIDMLGIGDAAGEIGYLRYHQGSFVRTLRDVDRLFGQQRPKRVLDLGCFLGAVSVPLARLGYDVDALDIPEFHSSATLRQLYERHGVRFVGVNLRNYRLPYPDHSFDAVIACELLEHLNFNPLPLMQELNRITKTGGYLYIGMPNLAFLGNRITLAAGRSIHPSIDDYFAQLDRNDNMVVGLHWREYSAREASAMLTRMGYEVVKAYYFAERHGSGVAALLKDVVYALVPAFKPYQVVIGKKHETIHHDFWLTAANS